MQIIPRIEPHKGSGEIFTGEVEVQPLKTTSTDSNISMSTVRFKAGARSAWHSHPYGQTLYITEGVGMIQKRGEPVQIVKSGDVIWTGPGEEHWHGASSKNDMCHLAIQGTDEDGNFAKWGDHVTDEEYAKQPVD